MRVGILGGGRWSEALARLVLAAGHDPYVAYRERSQKPPHVIPSTDDPPKVAEACELLLVATSSGEVRNALRLAQPTPAHVIVVAVRGLDPTTGDWLTDVVLQECPTPRVGALAGPAPAEEILQGGLCAGVVASRSEETRRLTVEALHSTRYRCYPTEDLTGVQLAGAMVPVLAALQGVTHHLGGSGVGLHAMVLSRGLAEATRLGEAVGADPTTFLGLAGVGDLVAVQSKPGHPSYDVGRALATGKPPKTDAVEKLARALHSFARLHRVDAPLLEAFVAMCDGRPPIDLVAGLMRRDPRRG